MTNYIWLVRITGINENETRVKIKHAKIHSALLKIKARDELRPCVKINIKSRNELEAYFKIMYVGMWHQRGKDKQ